MKELRPIEIATADAYKTHLTDTSFWLPFIAYLAGKHQLSIDCNNAQVGFNATYPVFIVGELVFKFFGFRPRWRQVFEDECKVHCLLNQDPSLLVPKILYSGFLFDTSQKKNWGYNILTKINGHSFLDYQLSPIDRLNVAHDLGILIKQVHSIPCDWEFKAAFWKALDCVGGAQKSILPQHLIEQIPVFLKKFNTFDNVLVNADIVEQHVFIKDGRLSGVIDWGDAAFIDRHYELGKLHLNVFDGDKELLAAFLKAADWPMSEDFASKSLAMAIYRQAAGLTQHNTFDVFYKLPKLIPLNTIKTLEELANVLFAV